MGTRGRVVIRDLQDLGVLVFLPNPIGSFGSGKKAEIPMQRSKAHIQQAFHQPTLLEFCWKQCAYICQIRFGVGDAKELGDKTIMQYVWNRTSKRMHSIIKHN